MNKGDSKGITLRGANLESIKGVFFENRALTFELSKDKLSIELFVPSTVTGSTGEKQITMVMKDDKRVPYTIVVW